VASVFVVLLELSSLAFLHRLGYGLVGRKRQARTFFLTSLVIVKRPSTPARSIFLSE
jgi:hypothetical protein